MKLYHSKKWLTTRTAVLARDPICTAGTVCGGKRLSSEVDHIVPLSQGGAEYDLANLRGICSACHAVKSGHEAGGRVA